MTGALSKEHKDAICALCRCHIKENALFTSLTESQLHAFKSVVSIYPFKKREVIFMEGSACKGLYVVRTGRVKILRTSSNGKEQIIKILNPGDLLGFEVFYDGVSYENSAMAMEDAELCYIDRANFFRIIEKEPQIAKKLIIAMGRELSQAFDKIGYLGLLNAKEKLANLLYTLASEYGVKCDRGVRLNLKLSRLEVAELLGITQETSIRLLKGFKEDGLIEIKRKEIIIKSLERLKELGE